MRYTLRATSCSWHRLGNSLAKTHSASDIVPLTQIGQHCERHYVEWTYDFGQHCEQHNAADIDRAMVWLRCTLQATSSDWPGSGNGLAETHFANNIMRTDMDRATVWPICTLRATLCGWHRSGTDLAGCNLWATTCGWHGSGNSWVAVWHCKNSIESDALLQKEHSIKFVRKLHTQLTRSQLFP